MIRGSWGVYSILAMGFTLTHTWTQMSNNTETCAILYEKGVEAYLEDNYQKCVQYFEMALDKYRTYNTILQNCRIQCKKEASESQLLYDYDLEDLHFFEKTIKNTLCIVKCRKKHKDTFELYNINKETEELFENRRPYEYLHICYFQTKQYLKAASSAFTYLALHTDDKSMLASLKYYTTNYPEADVKKIVNYEAKEYVYLYVHGSDAYDKEDWDGVVQNMEESLVLYLHAEDECRMQCEGPFDPGWYPDFIPSIANHFTFCLRCKSKCRDKLSSLNGEKHADLVASHYHYLQYAYFKRGKLKAACRAVASYLLFYPDDDVMKYNLKYYKSLPGVSEDFFTPREEAIYYTKREAYERKLLKYIFEEFYFNTTSIGKEQAKCLRIEITKDSKVLNGQRRFVAKKLLVPNQCASLVNVAKSFVKSGDGYIENKTPHSKKEFFGGIALDRLGFLVSVGLVNAKYLGMIVDVTDTAKNLVENYFNITNLYFSYTHLVCRSAVPSLDSQGTTTVFSHDVHADNCNLQPDGSCEKAYPSYTSRDYSAIIYLNDDISGGEFIFVSDYNGEEIQSMVKPECGTMVAFSSGVENLHAVKAVTRGTRCAVAVWFTFDSTKTEDRRFVQGLCMCANIFGNNRPALVIIWTITVSFGEILNSK